jgi:hypothetical protein
MERRRPPALTVLSIVAIVLGSLTLMMALWQVVALAVQEPLQRANMRMIQPPPMPGATPEAQQRSERVTDVQRRMMEQSFAQQRAWAPFQWAVSPIAAVFGVFLILGGAWCLKGNPAGRRVLAYTCAFAILFSIVRDVGVMMMQLEISQSMRDSMQELFEEVTPEPAPGVAPGGPDPRQIEQMMTGFMGAASAIGVGFYGMWLLLKLSFFVWALVYLTREQTRRFYEGGLPA